MRVLHVANGRLFGGIERMLVTMASSPQEAEPLRFSFAVCSDGRLSDELRTASASVYPLGNVRLSRPASVWTARSRLHEIVDSVRPDVLICHAPWAFAIFAPVGRAAGVPTVWWQHDRATGKSLVEQWARRTSADLVICNSRWTARSTPAVQPAAPVDVISCPVETPHPLSCDERAILRRTLGAHSDDVVMLIASRLEPWKGHGSLLRALGELLSVPRWRLWIAGGAQRRHEVRYQLELRRQAKDLGLEERVRFLNERRDVAALMSAADLVCQPNERPEPFGIVFAEALLCGKPVIAVASGGVPEIVDERCGRLVPPADLATLIRAIRELVQDSDLRARLGAAGPAHARVRCAPEVVLPKLARTLQGLCSPAAA